MLLTHIAEKVCRGYAHFLFLSHSNCRQAHAASAAVVTALFKQFAHSCCCVTDVPLIAVVDGIPNLLFFRAPLLVREARVHDEGSNLSDLNTESLSDGNLFVLCDARKKRKNVCDGV